jgi:hypothetical protein
MTKDPRPGRAWSPPKISSAFASSTCGRLGSVSFGASSVAEQWSIYPHIARFDAL